MNQFSLQFIPSGSSLVTAIAWTHQHCHVPGEYQMCQSNDFLYLITVQIQQECAVWGLFFIFIKFIGIFFVIKGTIRFLAWAGFIIKNKFKAVLKKLWMYSNCILTEFKLTAIYWAAFRLVKLVFKNIQGLFPCKTFNQGIHLAIMNIFLALFSDLFPSYFQGLWGIFIVLYGTRKWTEVGEG